MKEGPSALAKSFPTRSLQHCSWVSLGSSCSRLFLNIRPSWCWCQGKVAPSRGSVAFLMLPRAADLDHQGRKRVKGGRRTPKSVCKPLTALRSVLRCVKAQHHSRHHSGWQEEHTHSYIQKAMEKTWFQANCLSGFLLEEGMGNGVKHVICLQGFLFGLNLLLAAGAVYRACKWGMSPLSYWQKNKSFKPWFYYVNFLATGILSVPWWEGFPPQV